MATETLHISLPDTLRSYVEERVRDGQYGNTSEFIRELIRRDRDDQLRERREGLETQLLAAIESLERGEGFDGTPEYWGSFRQRARERLASASRVAEK